MAPLDLEDQLSEVLVSLHHPMRLGDLLHRIDSVDDGPKHRRPVSRLEQRHQALGKLPHQCRSLVWPPRPHHAADDLEPPVQQLIQLDIPLPSTHQSQDNEPTLQREHRKMICQCRPSDHIDD
jgi:hypothetical protein